MTKEYNQLNKERVAKARAGFNRYASMYIHHCASLCRIVQIELRMFKYVRDLDDCSIFEVMWENPFITIGEIAKQRQVSVRTIQRHITNSGSSFNELCEFVRLLKLMTYFQGDYDPSVTNDSLREALGFNSIGSLTVFLKKFLNVCTKVMVYRILGRDSPHILRLLLKMAR